MSLIVHEAATSLAADRDVLAIIRLVLEKWELLQPDERAVFVRVVQLLSTPVWVATGDADLEKLRRGTNEPR